MNPKLAMKINRQAEDAYYGFMSFYRMPFLVTMDEVVDDVYQFDGPAPFRERLYEDDDFTFSTYTTAFVNSRKVRIVEECMRNLDYSIVFRVLSDISADELMQHLGASDYTDMIERVKQQFSGKEALDSFREYLEAEGIAYEYAMETRGGEDWLLLRVDGVMKRDTVDYLWWLRIVDDRRKKVFCTNTFVGKEKIQQT